MRSLLRVGAAMVALLVATNVAVAQDGGGRRGGGGRGANGAQAAERLLTDITLTDEQKTKLEVVTKWYDEERAKLPPMGRGSDGTPPDSATRAAAMAANLKLTTDFRGKIKELLTPDQQTKFDANVAALPQGRGRRGGGGF